VAIARLPNVNVSIGNLDSEFPHEGSVFRLHLVRQFRVNPTLAPPTNGFNQGNPVNPRHVVLVGKAVEPAHIKQNSILYATYFGKKEGCPLPNGWWLGQLEELDMAFFGPRGL